MAFRIGLLASLMLGYVGEGGTREIAIDVSEWLQKWPTAEIVVHILRPDAYPYLPVVTVKDGILKWTVQKEEVEVKGKGLAFISAIDLNTGNEYKSRVVQTIIAATIEAFTGLEAGDPAASWVQKVLNARDEAKNAALRAEEAAARAEAACKNCPCNGGTVNPGEPDEPVEPVALPEYWQSHVDARVADVNSALEQAKADKSAFLFYSDAHWTYNYQQSPNLLVYLTKNTSIDKVIFGGDIMDEEEDTSYIAEWRAQLAELPSHHSVVGNHDDGNAPDGRWTAEEVYEYLLAPEVTDDVVRGGTLYYHIDVASEKTR